MVQKNMRFTDEMFAKFNELKKREKIETDIELLKRMIDYFETVHDTVPAAEFKELQKQYQALLIELGRLQGLLQSQQQALPKKKPWYKFW
jgi:hypothetical protein